MAAAREVRVLTSWHEGAGLAWHPGLKATQAAVVANGQGNPPTRVAVVMTDGVVVGHAAAWWGHGLRLEGQSAGAIGLLNAVDVEAMGQGVAALLDVLKAHEIPVVVGPMTGDTWHSYRIPTGGLENPAFFGEPVAPPWLVDVLAGAGFLSLAEYTSALAQPVAALTTNPHGAAQLTRFEALGVRFRGLVESDYEAELRHLHTLCAQSFANNFLYTPISPEAFLALYEPLRPYIQPELVHLAECDGTLVGFLLTLPDHLEAARGQGVETVLFKSIARLPDPRFKGLGSALFHRATLTAHAHGFRRIIHAFMSHDSPALPLSKHQHATPYRTYTLFYRPL